MNNLGGLSVREPRLYNIWKCMIQRCENEHRTSYPRYGGRGISVCAEWHDFIAFVMWAKSNGYSDSLTIDRIDNDGNYEPSNCRWSNAVAQANNKSNNVVISICGVSGTVKQWSQIINVSEYTIYAWVSSYGIECAAARISDKAVGIHHDYSMSTLIS